MRDAAPGTHRLPALEALPILGAAIALKHIADGGRIVIGSSNAGLSVAFLAAPGAAFVTGSGILVDGGIAA